MSHLVCKDCGCDMGLYSEDTAGITECTECGSRNIIRLLVVDEKITLHENLRGKSNKMPGKRKPRVEFQAGEEWSVERKKFVEKERRIDREQDTYHERVVDPDSGEVIHKCDEALTEHFGHGSAKFNKKDSPDAKITEES